MKSFLFFFYLFIWRIHSANFPYSRKEKAGIFLNFSMVAPSFVLNECSNQYTSKLNSIIKSTDFSTAKTEFVWIFDLHLALAPYYSPGLTKLSISYSLNLYLLYGEGKNNPAVKGMDDFLLRRVFFFLIL